MVLLNSKGKALMMTEKKSALDERPYSHLGQPEYFDIYRNLYFTPMGFARLWHTVGYFQGAGERGERALGELESFLEKLNGYGGKREGTQLSEYRVMIGDDGCWGSFTLAWCKLIRSEEFNQYMDEKKIGYSDAIKELRIQEELKIWDGASGYAHYRYTFNGGLILHRNGQEPCEGSYSTHT